VDVGGPHESSDGSAEMISESDIGAMIALGCGLAIWGFEIRGGFEFRDCGRTFGGARNILVTYGFTIVT
jgi:hypothetical protein